MPSVTLTKELMFFLCAHAHALCVTKTTKVAAMLGGVAMQG